MRQRLETNVDQTSCKRRDILSRRAALRGLGVTMALPSGERWSEENILREAKERVGISGGRGSSVLRATSGGPS